MILPWMLYASAVTLLLGVAAWLLERVMHQRGLPVRGVWMLAVLGSLLLPLLVSLLPRGRGLPESAPATPAAGGIQSSSPEPWVEWNSWTEPLTAVAAPAPDFNLDPWLLALWATASVLIALCLAFSYAILLRRRREWTLREVDSHAVWVSDDTGPAVVGILPGRIVVPAWLLRAGETERALILAHEEEHIRAGDPRLLLGALLIALALPWNLALWWMWRRLRQAVEIDCDRRVLAQGKDRRAYSRLLVEVCERGVAHRFAVASLAASSSFLERRIRLMLAPTPRRWRTRMGGAVLFATACVAAACGLQQPERTESGAVKVAANADQSMAATPSSQTNEESARVGPQQVAEFAGRAALERVDPEALEYCHKRAVGAQRTFRVSVLDSIELEVWGRGDTVLIAGAVERRNREGKTVRGGWTCDVIRENGKWRQWHFGLGPG